MLVLSALASTHLVALFLATIIYLLLVNRPIGLIDATKLNPHFINDSSNKVITNLAKFQEVNPLDLWHASQDLQNSKTS
jgi:fumarate reductase subunit D